MKDSIVSVIVPVYNKEKYLRTCMDSLLRQTLFEVEFICINDGSTDSSLKILEEYCRDSRVRVYDQRNHGTGYTRNKGIDLANGKYLMFLDADDFFEEDMLALLVKKAEKSSADITICGAIKFDTQLCKDVGENWWLNTKPFSTDVIEADNNCDILLLTESCVWNKLYRRGFVIENELRFQNLKNNNDTAFSLISLCLASIVAYVDRIFVHYRINHDGDSISANRGQHLECHSSPDMNSQELLRELDKKWTHVGWAGG